MLNAPARTDWRLSRKKFLFLFLGLGSIAGLLGLGRAFAQFPGDRWVLLEVIQWRTDGLNTVAVILSGLGYGGVGLGIPVPWIVIAVVAGVLVAKRWDEALFLAIALLAPAVNLGLKELAGRPRPDPVLALVQETGLSFPSGHAVFAMVFFGTLIVLLGRRKFFCEHKVAMHAMRGILILLVLAVGGSRVYLGAHWPSDVLAGFLFGGLYLVGQLVAWRAAIEIWNPRLCEDLETPKI